MKPPHNTGLIIPHCKRLNKSERAYLDSLLDSMDEQLLKTAEWLESKEAQRYRRLKGEAIDKFFKESGIKDEWDKITQAECDTAEKYIERFYDIGRKLGYNDIGTLLNYTPADMQSLFFLKQYNFALIRDVSAELQEGIRQTISQAVASGQAYKETAKQLMELPLQPIEGSNISLRARAEMIARTEHARALDNGTIQAYSNMGVTEVEVITAGDDLVCEDCLDIADNNPYGLKEASGLLPVHPNCRCSYGAITSTIADNPEDYVTVSLVPDDFIEQIEGEGEPEYVRD